MAINKLNKQEISLLFFMFKLKTELHLQVIFHTRQKKLCLELPRQSRKLSLNVRIRKSQLNFQRYILQE